MEDIVNSGFEFFAIVFIAKNCLSLYKDKKVSGVSIFSILFFTTWSFWNIIYYFILNQNYSFFCSVFVFIFNLIWLTLYFKYKI